MVRHIEQSVAVAQGTNSKHSFPRMRHRPLNSNHCYGKQYIASSTSSTKHEYQQREEPISAFPA